MASNGHYLCYLDDSHNNDDLFVLGGIIFEEKFKVDIRDKWNDYKGSLDLPIDAEIKWSPKDNKVKEALIKHYERNWLSSFRSESLSVIKRMDLKIVVAMHQDIRRLKKLKDLIKSNIPNSKIPRCFKNKLKISPTGFCREAFKYVLQRLGREFNEGNSRISVYLDFPPTSKQNMQHIETEIYKEAYKNGYRFLGNSIPSLEKLGFDEIPYFIEGKKSTFCQIADFCAGVVQNWGDKAIKGNPEGKALDFLKIVSNKFRRKEGNGSIVGYGIVVHPPQAEIHKFANKYLSDLKSVELHKEFL